MTSSYASNSRVTGPLCGEFTGHRWIPLTKVSDAELWCFFYLRLNKPLSKQWRRRWFETPSRSLWRHYNEIIGPRHPYFRLSITILLEMGGRHQHNCFITWQCNQHKHHSYRVSCITIIIKLIWFGYTCGQIRNCGKWSCEPCSLHEFLT